MKKLKQMSGPYSIGFELSSTAHGFVATDPNGNVLYHGKQAGPSALRRRLRCQRALPGEPRRAEGMVRRSRRAVRPGEMALVGQRDRRQAGRARAGGVQAERAIVIDRKKPR